MKTTLRGRPKLNIDMNHILEIVRRHGQIVAAARELGCSQAYIHARLKKAELTLHEVLEAENIAGLLQCHTYDGGRRHCQSPSLGGGPKGET